MSWGLVGAFAAAVAYGGATILQAVGARASGRTDDLDVHLVARLAHSVPYVVGLLLDGLGFGLSFAALRSLPLFTVQAIVASSLAVTAVLAVVFLDAHPAPREWAAVLVVTAGLTLLGLSASRQPPVRLDNGDRSLLVVSVVVVGAAAFTLVRRRTGGTAHEGWVLGGLAGLLYGASGIGARILRSPRHPWQLVQDPALWALAIAGVLGLLLYAMALQRGTVTTVTSSVVVAETLVPALVGITLLGDRPSHGDSLVAVAGFVMSVAGAVALARYGEAPAAGERPASEVSVVCPS